MQLSFRSLAGPLLALLALIAAGAARAAPIPPDVARMIDAAAGDPGALHTVARVARKSFPGSAAEIDARIAQIDAKAEADRQARIRSQTMFQGWKGAGQAGGFLSTGNSDDTGVDLGLDFAKETLAWRQAFKLSADYQRSDGEVSKQRYFAGYDGQWKLQPHTFVAIDLSAESDRFAGFHNRFAESVGLGYRLFDRPNLSLDVRAGPALRETDYLTGRHETAVSGRLGADFAWHVNPRTTLTETASAFIDSVNSSASSTTALTTRLEGAISARLAYDVRHESNPPAGTERTDTTSRVSLVYSF